MSECRRGRDGKKSRCTRSQMAGDSDSLVSDFSLSDIYPWVTAVTLQAQNVGHDIKYSRETWPGFWGAWGVPRFRWAVSTHRTVLDKSVDTGDQSKREQSVTSAVMFQVKQSSLPGSALENSVFHLPGSFLFEFRIRLWACGQPRLPAKDNMFRQHGIHSFICSLAHSPTSG